MRIFVKNVKNRLCVGGSAPEPPLASGGWRIRPKKPALLLPPTITTLSTSFLAPEVRFITLKKEKYLLLPNFCTYFSL